MQLMVQKRVHTQKTAAFYQYLKEDVGLSNYVSLLLTYDKYSHCLKVLSKKLDKKDFICITDLKTAVISFIHGLKNRQERVVVLRYLLLPLTI